MWRSTRGELAEFQASFELHPARFAKFNWQNFKRQLVELYVSPELYLAKSATLSKISIGELANLRMSSELHPARFSKHAWQNFKAELAELYASSELCPTKFA